jgi:hypothetical protein
MAPEVDPDRPEDAAGREAAGDGIEETGAEPVGVEEHQRTGTIGAAPVEGGDRQAVVVDGERTGIVYVDFFARLGATRGGSLGIFG